MHTATDKTWSGMFNVLALSNTLHIAIESICPNVASTMKSMFLTTVSPNTVTIDNSDTLKVHIMWSRGNLGNNPDVPFQPDHIVALSNKGVNRPCSEETVSYPRKKKSQQALGHYF